MKDYYNPDLKVNSISKSLEGITIALCISGGIAAIETPKLARHLRRYGAEVKAYTTQNAYKFIGKTSLEWATEKEVIDELSGLAEHICQEDIVLVAPATLNTINKFAYGIADNVVTTLLASALGGEKDIYLVPTMHESLYCNPILKENLEKLQKYNVKIISPRLCEGKAKIPHIQSIVDIILKDMEDKNEKS